MKAVQDFQKADLILIGTCGGFALDEEFSLMSIEKALKNTKPKIDLLGSIFEYKSPAELKKWRDDEYKQIYEIAVKIGIRNP